MKFDIAGHRRTTALVVAALAVPGLLLAGCGKESASVEKDADGLSTITIGTYPTSTTVLPYQVALKQGFFEREQLRVETVESSGGPALAAALIGGTTQIAVAVPSNIFTAMEEGSPMVALPPFGKLDLSLVVLDKSPIVSVQQLDGKKVGVTARGAQTEAVGAAMLEEQGVDVSFVAVGPLSAYLAAMRAGSIDAAVVSSDAIALFEAEGLKMRKIAVPTGDLGKYGLHTLYTTTKDFRDANPEVMGAFCRSMKAAVGWIADPQNKDAATTLISELIGVPPTLAGDIWEMERDYFSMQIDESTWKFNVDWVLQDDKKLPFDSNVAQNCG